MSNKFAAGTLIIDNSIYEAPFLSEILMQFCLYKSFNIAKFCVNFYFVKFKYLKIILVY